MHHKCCGWGGAGKGMAAGALAPGAALRSSTPRQRAFPACPPTLLSGLQCCAKTSNASASCLFGRSHDNFLTRAPAPSSTPSDPQMTHNQLLRLVVAMESALGDGRYEEAARLRDEFRKLSANAPSEQRRS